MILKFLCSKGSNLVKRSSFRIGEKFLYFVWMLMGCKWGRIFKNLKMYKKLDK